jgi:hypothetical protein
VTETQQESTHSMECPHCHRTVEAEPLPVGRAARYHGFKCPHCNLFVPAARVDASEPLSRDSDA